MAKSRKQLEEAAERFFFNLFTKALSAKAEEGYGTLITGETSGPNEILIRIKTSEPAEEVLGKHMGRREGGLA